MNIEWIIEWMQTTPPSADPPLYVLTVGWRCNGTDGEISGTCYGTCSFSPEANEDGSFTPYADLTQNQVLAWCWNSGVPREATEEAVAAQIEAQKHPPVINPPLPWSASNE